MDRIELHNGDCLEMMRGLPDNSVDLILTDPPYGMNLKPQRAKGKFHGVKIKNDDHLAWSEGFFKECYRVLGPDRAAFVFCSHHCVSEFIRDAKAVGFEVKNLLVWDKGHFGMGGNWRPCHELVLVLTNGRFVTHSNSLKTIVSFKKVHHSRAVHPTEKPIDILQHFIEQPDFDANVVLGPFMGSGTTGVACVNTGRRFIGIELDKDYFEIAKTRIDSAINNLNDQESLL